MFHLTARSMLLVFCLPATILGQRLRGEQRELQSAGGNDGNNRMNNNVMAMVDVTAPSSTPPAAPSVSPTPGPLLKAVHSVQWGSATQDCILDNPTVHISCQPNHSLNILEQPQPSSECSMTDEHEMTCRLNDSRVRQGVIVFTCTGLEDPTATASMERTSATDCSGTTSRRHRGGNALQYLVLGRSCGFVFIEEDSKEDIEEGFVRNYDFTYPCQSGQDLEMGPRQVCLSRDSCSTPCWGNAVECPSCLSHLNALSVSNFDQRPSCTEMLPQMIV